MKPNIMMAVPSPENGVSSPDVKQQMSILAMGSLSYLKNDGFTYLELSTALAAWYNM